MALFAPLAQCDESAEQQDGEILKAPVREGSRLTGEYYESVVPDTLDLAERARLAVNALTGSADPRNNYEIFQCAHLDQQPPNFNHKDGGPSIPKTIDVLPMMRRMSGSKQNEDYDMKIVNSMLRDVDQNGLWWMRLENRPWRKRFGEDVFWPFPQGRLIVGLLAWHDFDQNPAWLPITETLVHGLHKVAGQNEQRAWFENSHTPRIEMAAFAESFDESEDPIVEQSDKPNQPVEPSEPASVQMQTNGNVLRALAQWYALSGDENTKQLAEKLSRFMLKPGLWGGNKGNGPTMVDPYEHAKWYSHFHWFTTGVMGMTDYATTVHDSQQLRYLQWFYEYSRQFGSVRIGFFPAVISPLTQRQQGNKKIWGGTGQSDEACALAEMIYIAIKLSEAGVGDYWEDVDSMVRNHLVEHQLTDRKRLEHIIAHSPKFKMDPRINCTDDVLERNIGSFASCAELTKSYAWWSMCCNPNAMMALYEAWDAIVRYDNGMAQVNLLLNRASPWVDIDSYLPYEGKVVLKNKKARKMSVRIPMWADKNAVHCKVNDEERPLQWVGRYLLVSRIEPKDTVTITFPIVETTEKHTEPSYNQTYTCHFKGNTLIDISPRPEEFNWAKIASDDGAWTELNKEMGYPLYQREHMKATKAPMRQVTRYVHSF